MDDGAMLMAMTIQLANPIKHRGWGNPDMGKAFDFYCITHERVLAPPGIDFYEHMTQATKVIRARVYRFEQGQRTIPLYICTAESHKLTCDTVTLGYKKETDFIAQLSVTRK